jgi:hypothetical protein
LALWTFALLSVLKIDALATRGVVRGRAAGGRIRPAGRAARSRPRAGIDPEQRNSRVKA